MFGQLKPGDQVVTKSGVSAKVLKVQYGSVFIEFIGNISGKPVQSWVSKSRVRKA
jgi:preprotein translocase subunit YajC